jgi:hypothetical protein
LKGGICADALADFTGGIVESYSLKHYTPVDFGHVLSAAIERDALICSGIWVYILLFLLFEYLLRYFDLFRVMVIQINYCRMV